MAAVAEGNHDERRPDLAARARPADVHVVATGKDEDVFADGRRGHRRARAPRRQVLYDDRRKVSPGVKFKDAELIGVPTIVVRRPRPGRRHDRGQRPAQRGQRDVPVAEAVDAIVAEVRGASAS